MPSHSWPWSVATGKKVWELSKVISKWKTPTVWQHAEKQYVINIIAHSPITQGVIIVNKDLRNVPEKAANSWPHRAESTGYPEQFYYGK